MLVKVVKFFIFRRIALSVLALAVVGITIVLLKIPAFPDGSKPAAYETSINTGLAYLKDNEEQIAYSQWFILDYLQRKYGLDEAFSARNREISPPQEEDSLQEFHVHKRIAYPDQLINELPLEGASSMRQMMMMAAHCDHIPLPADYEQLVRKNIQAGDYDMTHVAFSLERMKENGCAFPAELDKELRDDVSQRMVDLAKDISTKPDLRYEAVAFLMHMGRRDLVQAEWIKQIVQQQQPDGGWKVNHEDSASNDHATVLALLALLEYSRPNAPNEPMLRRPNHT